MERVITITETASKAFSADTSVVHLSATGEGKTGKIASDTATATANKVIDELRANGFNEVRANGVSVNEKRDGKKIVGYRAVRNYTVEFDCAPENISTVIETLSNSDCEWRISYRLKPDKESELIEKAVANARVHAARIASAAGVELGELVKAEYCGSDGGAAQPMLMHVRAVNTADAVEPQTISLSQTVVCSFEIK